MPTLTNLEAIRTALAEELERDTWSAYIKIHQELLTLALKLRPEVAAMFSEPQRLDLLQRLGTLEKTLARYAEGLNLAKSDQGPQRAALPSGERGR